MYRGLTNEERRRMEHRKRVRSRRRNRRIAGRIFLISLFVFVLIFGYMQIAKFNESKADTRQAEGSKTDSDGETIDINDYIEAGLSSDYINYVRQINNKVGNRESAKTIIDNIEKYPEDVLDLLISNTETLEFALGYLNREDYVNAKITLSKPEDGEIPLYQQWDTRWGYREYGDNLIAINGCGPTCLSMVAVGLLKDTSLNPAKICEYSENNGYYDSVNGTLWDLMRKGASGLGLKVTEIGLDKEVIINHLNKGHPIIATMGPGDFTTTGHFIVLTGINDQEEVTVNDPNNISRSNKKWDLDTITSQVKNLWAFSKK